MKIACISTSSVPSIHRQQHSGDEGLPGHSPAGTRCPSVGTRPGIGVTLTSSVRLYGLHKEFEISWLPAMNRLKRYDFAWKAVAAPSVGSRT